MELSQEVYSIIVRHVGTRSDLNSLCRVSKRFRREAEKALYNTLHLRGQARSVSICNVLNHAPRLALLVEALSVFVEGGDSEEDDEEDDSDIDMGSESSYSDDFWTTVASALRQTTKLRFLSVYLERVGQSQHAWILDGCTFQLRTFHSDFDWDHHLETFLRSQTSLHDLYLADYMTPGCPASSRTPFYNTSSPLPSLSMLECTLSEAAVALVPGRPVERVKTCFSKTKVEDKRAELRALLLGLRRSKKPLRTLDLADDVYQSSFTLELVAAIDRILAGKHKLRYLGTLVYPVDPSERVDFYTRLMRLPHLQCLELEVTEWDPPPMTPAALRSLTYELRIYCPKVDRVVYVYDFDRVTMKIVDGLCVLDNETAAESLWREI